MADVVVASQFGWQIEFAQSPDPDIEFILKSHFPEVAISSSFIPFKNVEVFSTRSPGPPRFTKAREPRLDMDYLELALQSFDIAEKLSSRWLVWETNPRFLCSNRGKDFAKVLLHLGKLGYGFAYRVLDAQFFGVPQRRRRVFVVGCAGDWRGAAAVLSERNSLSGHSAPRRKAGQDVAGVLTSRSSGGGGGPGAGTDEAAAGYLQPVLAHALRGEGFDASEDGTERGTPLVPVCFSAKDHGADAGEIAPTLRAGGHSGSHANAGVMPAIAFAQNTRDEVRLQGGDGQVVGALAAQPGMKQTTYVAASAVRRLTPRECERLQGFPDDYTLVPHRGKPMADGPRYKALGNSMAVPVMRWIGERIAQVEALTAEQQSRAA